MRCDVGAGGFAGAFFASGALLNYTLGGVARLQCFGRGRRLLPEQPKHTATFETA